MIEVTKERWDAIDDDYKGLWHDYYGDHPEWLGKRVVMSGCIADGLGELLIEDVHFVIVE